MTTSEAVESHRRAGILALPLRIIERFKGEDRAISLVHESFLTSKEYSNYFDSTEGLALFHAHELIKPVALSHGFNARLRAKFHPHYQGFMNLMTYDLDITPKGSTGESPHRSLTTLAEDLQDKLDSYSLQDEDFLSPDGVVRVKAYIQNAIDVIQTELVEGDM